MHENVAPKTSAIRIAVASQNFRTVTGHAGKCRRFLVFEAEKGAAPREIARLDLPKEMVIRSFPGTAKHPLDDMNALIVGSAGPGFIGRMSARKVHVVTTSEEDPLSAVSKYMAGNLPPASRSGAENMTGETHEATEFLKAMANETRLMILCALSQGEKSVSELERRLEISQSRVSQQLARLRRAGLVAARPAGLSVYYSLSSPQVRVIVDAVYEAHCERAAKN